MPRYIDEEKINFKGADRYFDENNDTLVSLGEVMQIIKSTPTADVVEVVRCRDCKYAFLHPLGCIYCHRDGRNSYEMVFEKDSFCSYGERKDGE